jgi:hypothetical protein
VAASPAAPGAGWFARIVATLAAMPVYPVLLVSVVAASVLAIVATRRSDRLGIRAALFATVGCVAGDAMLLSGALLGGRAGGWMLPLALLASAARLTVVLRAGRRVYRLRTAAA